MGVFPTLCIIAVFTASAISTKPFLRKTSQESRIANEYIVVFKDEVGDNTDDAASQIKIKLDQFGEENAMIKKVFKKAIKGAVLGAFPEALVANLEAVADELGIAFIEENSKVEPAELWNLDRIDQLDLPLDGATFSPTGDGTGVNVYLVDSGIVDQDEFANEPVVDFYDAYHGPRKAPRSGDCYGHGTHMAGTIGSLTYGVAENVNLLSVRVFDCDGYSTWGYVIDALEHILSDADPNIPSVINLSLSGAISDATNAAVDNLYDAGFLPVVAAGNYGVDACTTTPASATKVVVVGGFNQSDSQTFNYGPCIDIFAPAHNILSLNYDKIKKNPTAIKHGTSSATAHVSGVAAIIRGNNPSWTPSDVENYIKTSATIGRLSNLGPGSQNRMIYVD